MVESPRRWAAASAAVASSVYVCIVALLLLRIQDSSDPMDSAAQWVAIPVQVMAIVLVALLLSGRRLAPGPERAAWWCVLAFAAGSPIATYVWNVFRPDSGKEARTACISRTIGP
jgi:hypothetical protein